MDLAFVPNKDEKSSGKNNERSCVSNEICIITDEPITDAADFDKSSQTLCNIIANSVPRFTVGIYGGWGTGKTTIMQMIQKHLDEEHKNDILTIWFDAWRYENEEFSALVPLVRTIILHLEDYVKKLEIENSPKKAVIKNLADKFKKVGQAILQNSKVSAEASYSIANEYVKTALPVAVMYHITLNKLVSYAIESAISRYHIIVTKLAIVLLSSLLPFFKMHKFTYIDSR
ncbi:MAG: P-loop NTPase fold protein [Candidatus Nitrosopolaris sp.]